MKSIYKICIVTFLLFFSMFGCTETSSPIKTIGGAGQPCYTNGTCDSGLTCSADICVDENDQENKDDEESKDDAKPDSEEKDDKETPDDNTDNTNCDTESIGNSCSLDNECGKCNICVASKCTKGCVSDEDCLMYSGLKCNKKLSRCTNVYASNKACGETKCPTGCCYSDRGLTELTCLAQPAAAKCGLCANGEIFNGEECIPAVCSSTTDNCPTLNSFSTDPKPECFNCKSGEFICKDDGCEGSSGIMINAATCIPAGQKCVAGISECCSGMPCVEGYCY